MKFDDAIQFVRDWQTSATLTEFCARTSMDKRSASNFAAQLRRERANVPLKRMPREQMHYDTLTASELALLRMVARNPEMNIADVENSSLARKMRDGPPGYVVAPLPHGERWAVTKGLLIAAYCDSEQEADRVALELTKRDGPVALRKRAAGGQ